MKIKNIIHQQTKTLEVRPNGRSSDFVTPNFILGCQASCLYCYTKRWKRDNIYINTNTDLFSPSGNKILGIIKHHSENVSIQKPNQIDDKYITYDIGCSTDVTYYWKKYNWVEVLTFFQNHNIKSTFATKFVNNKMLDFPANEQNRIRFSIMPQTIANVVQPNVTNELLKIKAIDYAKSKGWDVHINFSPVIYYNGWKKDYSKLFQDIDRLVKNKTNVYCEVIFLTHNENLHNVNMVDNPEVENLLWNPKIQEPKTSNYGGNNVRYQYQLKKEFIEEFKAIHNKYISWCKIRYIF